MGEEMIGYLLLGVLIGVAVTTFTFALMMVGDEGYDYHDDDDADEQQPKRQQAG